MYDAETWTPGKVDKILLEGFHTWCWRRMAISWTDRWRNEVVHRAKEERKIHHTIKRMKTKWIAHVLCRNCLLKHAIEGKIEGREVTGR